MTPEDARARLSDYLEDALPPTERAELDAVLARNPALAGELSQLSHVLTLLHQTPEREPSLDLWREFAPHMAQFQAERKLSVWARLRQNAEHLRSELSAGLILWTHAVAARAQTRLERYLLSDPLPPASQ